MSEVRTHADFSSRGVTWAKELKSTALDHSAIMPSGLKETQSTIYHSCCGKIVIVVFSMSSAAINGGSNGLRQFLFRSRRIPGNWLSLTLLQFHTQNSSIY